jgi:hypothetical protein
MVRTDERATLQAELEAAVDEAFERYRVVAFWSKRRPATATPVAARQLAYSLRREGPLAGRALAERIEELSDAIDQLSTGGAEQHRAEPRP